MESLPVQTLGSDAWADQCVASLHAERDGVREFLAAQQTRLERAEATIEEAIARLEAAISDDAAEGGDKAGGGEDDYRRRYEMALDDLRELKAGNSLLQEQLSKARATASTLAKQNRSHETGLDWETEKLRILAALESDLDENDSEQRAERLKIEDVLQTTENVIAGKDREIQELKQRLEQSPPAAPWTKWRPRSSRRFRTTSSFSGSENGCGSWRNNCRADCAGRRSRFRWSARNSPANAPRSNERLRMAGLDAAKLAGESNAAEQPPRGRWLSRLGLTEADRERGKHR